MWCERCKQRPATVHVTKIVNNAKTESHLCEVCAGETGTDLGFLFEPNFSFHNLLAGLLENEFGVKSGNVPQSTKKSLRKCPTCGLTFTDFMNIGLMGCANCYETFKDNLDPLLRRIHGSTVHIGKVPKRTGGQVRVRKEIEQLRRKLQEAVNREAYEEAAKIRDEIKEKEKKLKGGDGGVTTG
jgi:protein arginine kinase activator